MALVLNGSGITSANIADGTIVNADINSSAAIDGSKLTGAGKVLQVVQAVKTDTFSTTSGTTFVDVTGLSVSITPTSTSSKILVYLSSNFSTIATGWAQAQLTNASNTELAVIHSRAETEMVVQPFTHIYLDSPASTSEQTYKYRLAAETAGAVWVNRMKATAFEVDVSTITVMEIAG